MSNKPSNDFASRNEEPIPGKTPVTSENRDLLAKKALEDLKSSLENNNSIITVDGKKMLGEDDVPYSTSYIMSEAEFVKKWLVPFAVGNTCGINMFPLGEWFEISTAGTGTVLIKNDKGESVICIEPIIRTAMDESDVNFMRAAGMVMKSNSENNVSILNPAASLEVADQISNRFSKHKRINYSDLVPDWFFKKHGINQEALRKAYYIQEVLVGEKLPKDLFNTVLSILTKLQEGETITPEERDFIKTASNDEIEIDESKVSKNSSKRTIDSQKPEDFDPLAC